MGAQWNRRDLLKRLAAASSAIVLPHQLRATPQDQSLALPPIETQITPITPHTFRLSILSVENGVVQAIPFDGSLVQESWGAPIARLRGPSVRTTAVGRLKLSTSVHPFSATLTGVDGNVVQQFAWDHNTGRFSFLIGNSTLFGLGEGGAQFDRRGIVDLMKHGQGGYQLATHGGRLPIPWIISASGWAIFFHQPYGTLGETFSGVDYDVALAAIENIRRILPSQVSMAQFALRWILMFDAVTCAIPGGKNVDQGDGELSCI